MGGVWSFLRRGGPGRVTTMGRPWVWCAWVGRGGVKIDIDAQAGFGAVFLPLKEPGFPCYASSLPYLKSLTPSTT